VNKKAPSISHGGYLARPIGQRVPIGKSWY
jgi:hypothetical protein